MSVHGPGPGPGTTQVWERVMVTGHRPHLLAWPQADFARAELVRLAAKLRDRHGMREAISGMALGADTWWARAALDAGVPLAAYIPFEAQPRYWDEQDQQVWRDLRASAAREVVCGTHPSVRALHRRNDTMLRDADLVLALWDPRISRGGTASCVTKARLTRRDLVIVDLERMSTRIETGTSW